GERARWNEVDRPAQPSANLGDPARLEDNRRMATLPNSEELWTVREYLRSSWSPDREYVDGRIEERNLGEKEHSILQRYFTFLFMLKRSDWRVEVFPELRTQTQTTRFRVPDVLV